MSRDLTIFFCDVINVFEGMRVDFNDALFAV